MSKAIIKKLIAAKKAYYNDEPVMSDEAFDALEDELRKADPKNDYFKVVGASVGNSKTKVKHEIPMLSCGKAKTPDESLEWLQKIGASKEIILIQPKIDGLSCACIYENGKLVMIKTRGDSFVGQNITHIAAHVNIPKAIDNRESKRTVEIRGELYIPKNSKVPNPENKALRNIAVGIINRKNHGLEDLKHIHFIAYQIHGASERIGLESNKMEWLKDNDFEVVWSFTTDNPQKGIKWAYENYLEHFRASWLYTTDGLVLTINDNTLWPSINSKYEVSHHNHYNIALKPPSEGKETELINIEWSVSRLGKLQPVAIFKTVQLGGANVSKASLSNYGNVLKMKFEKGDRIFVSRSNDVIPYVEQNISKNISQR